jgi:hypothetical protein
MKKYLIIALLALPVYISFNPAKPATDKKLHETVNDTIYWSAGEKLNWDDFNATPDDRTDALAVTGSAISASYSFKDSQVKMGARSFFLRSKSWVKKKEDYLLRHEQLHFNITEIYARKIRKAFSKSSTTDNKSSKALYKKVFSSLNAECKEYQNKYDRETRHSIIKEKQLEWDEKITKELEDLDDYKW